MEPVLASKKRIDSIDILRGIIMIIMALDHVRDFFHTGAMTSDPTNPATTTPILFFTRFITHYCAPVFVLLAGTSAFLYGRKKTKKELSVFLLKRGVWLMVLEILVVNLLFGFDPLYHFIGLQVIWVTGLSMVLLAAFIYLPLKAIFFIGLALVAGHNLLDVFNTNSMGTPPPLWYSVLHQQSFRPYGEGRFLGVLYPLIPWPGIMMLGYCLGTLFTADYGAAKRRRTLVSLGSLAILVFLVLRWINVYGDLVPWSEQKNNTATILSFFNVTKYPPSLLYCCITIGPALLVLAALEKVKAGWTNIVVIYGRVPMFYYLTHFFLIHLLCTIGFFATGHTMSQAAGGIMLFRPNDFGVSLGAVYLIWIGVVAFLYPFCKRYSVYKATHNHWWLPYL
ncbi:MAG: heparan-alpha-glucosaminide N-acetyltransferase domain-containing protein [Bacteroidota bacterium]